MTIIITIKTTITIIVPITVTDDGITIVSNVDGATYKKVLIEPKPILNIFIPKTMRPFVKVTLDKEVHKENDSIP